MAMNLRLPELIDQQLAEIATAENTSKHKLLLQGAQMVIHRRGRMAQINEGLAFVQEHDGELLTRLEDA